MEQKDKLNNANTGEELLKKKKLEEEIETLLNEIDSDLKTLSKELNIQRRKKGQYSDIKIKEDIMEKLEEKVQILRNKDKNEENDQEKLIENLSSFLESHQNSSQDEDKRELTDEEKKKIEEWKKKTNEQDKNFEEMRIIIGDIKTKAISIGQNINNVGIKVNDLNGKMVKTENNIKSQNERLKELVNQIRSSDKICCDIILILIFLRLVCVLYSVIKHRLIKK